MSAQANGRAPVVVYMNQGKNGMSSTKKRQKACQTTVGPTVKNHKKRRARQPAANRTSGKKVQPRRCEFNSGGNPQCYNSVRMAQPR